MLGQTQHLDAGLRSPKPMLVAATFHVTDIFARIAQTVTHEARLIDRHSTGSVSCARATPMMANAVKQIAITRMPRPLSSRRHKRARAGTAA